MGSLVRAAPIVLGVGLLLVALNALASYSVDYVANTLNLDIAHTVTGVYSAELVARVAVVGLCVWKISRVVASVDAEDYRVVFSDRAFLLILSLFAFMAAQLDNRLYWYARVVNGEVTSVLNLDGAHRAAFITLCVKCIGVLLLNFRTLLGAFTGLALMTTACVLGFLVAVSVIH